MKFKLDENVPLRLKSTITNAGHVASDVYEQNLAGKTDQLVFQRCKEEGYILVTNDTDFENIQAYPPGTHPGIILLRLRSQDLRSVITAFCELLDKVDLDKVNGSLIIVGPEMIKVRKEAGVFS